MQGQKRSVRQPPSVASHTYDLSSNLWPQKTEHNYLLHGTEKQISKLGEDRSINHVTILSTVADKIFHTRALVKKIKKIVYYSTVYFSYWHILHRARIQLTLTVAHLKCFA